MIMNIEKTISEHAVSDILTPMLDCQDRIVTEDVAPLFDQATGLDTPPASGTVTTTIEESRSVITAIIRKAWTATLTMLCGASVIGYITAAYTYLRNRLQGNETYGIPDRRSEISASSPLAANLALLNDRKIGGVPEAEDGMSLVQLLCAANSITEVTDDTTGWAMTKAFPWSLFPNVTKARFNCVSSGAFAICPATNVAELELPELVRIEGDNAGILYANNNVIERLYLPKFKGNYTYGRYGRIAMSCSAIKEIIMPVFEYVGGDNGPYNIRNCDSLWKVVMGKIIYNGALQWYFPGCPKLIHLEIGADTAVSLNLSGWNPSYVLSDNPTGTDLIEEGSTAQNNLQQFLQNFRDYIADKLQGGYPIGQGPILTLSQAVHNAITAAEDDYHIREIITQKGWTISPAPN